MAKKRFKQQIHDFFFPPAGSPTWVKILPYALLGFLTLLLLTGAAYGWEYTNSPPFCGETCHTMPPEYTAYQTSPHARIDCVDCHIGKGFIATRITRKAGDIRHIVNTAFHNYEFPIRAGDMRPARETCEKCHFPEKFSDDSLREIKRYGNDKDNTPTSIYLTLKTGGGSQRQGLGRGIHWHIENPVYYLPTDAEQQDIPYVRVMNADGSSQDYIDLESGVKPEEINPADLKEMDCITCHNRITHLVQTPEDTIDRLIAAGEIARDIPEIRLKSIEAYSQIFKSTQEGLNNIAGLENYYKTYYPDYYVKNQEKIASAIKTLQDAYGASVFPEQNSDWTTHPNNIGHKESPGCFRCHDGKHVDANGEAIRLECNLCHEIPVVVGPYDFIADLPLSRGPEPESHKNPNWIAMHHQVFNPTCANCHDTSNPGGTDNTSFCSNSACHGAKWEFAGFDAPELRKAVLAQLPPTPTPQTLPTGGALTYNDSIGPLFQARCGSCHGENGINGLNLLTYLTALQGSENGAVINPGDAQGSLLVQKQSAAQPHFGQLTPEELQLVMDWINAGAVEK